MAKTEYKVTNWPEYNQALVKRGDLTLWLNDAVIREWETPQPERRRGRPKTYSDTALECMLALRSFYRLPLRATEGLMQSIFVLLGVTCRVPTFATLSRRQGRLIIDPAALLDGEPIHLLVDSTGVKVFGEGEWKVRKHGIGKRRAWRKLHLGIDEATRQIVAVELTTNDVGDSEVFPRLLLSIEGEIEKVCADGAYDTWNCRYRIAEAGAEAVIPPRRGSVTSEGSHRSVQERNEAIDHIDSHGEKDWKRKSGYHRRSLAETAMFQIKTTFGAETQARSIQNQIAEAVMKSKILNTFIRNGLPQSIKIED